MTKKPVYVFDTALSTGIDIIPVNNMMLIKDMDGAGTPKLIYISDKTSITNTTTITELIALTGQWYEIGGAGSGGAGGYIKRQDFVATANQTDFVCLSTLSTPAVYVEGLLLDTDEYTVIDNQVVVFNVGLSVGTEVSIITSIPTANDLILLERAVATVGQTEFPTPFDLLTEVVYLNGVLQDGNYDVTNRLITFHDGLIAGDIVKIFASTPVISNLIGLFSEVNYDAGIAETSFAASYTPGSIQVFVNGIKLRANDFTASNGTSVVIPEAKEADWIQIVVYTTTS